MYINWCARVCYTYVCNVRVYPRNVRPLATGVYRPSSSRRCVYHKHRLYTPPLADLLDRCSCLRVHFIAERNTEKQIEFLLKSSTFYFKLVSRELYYVLLRYSIIVNIHLHIIIIHILFIVVESI